MGKGAALAFYCDDGDAGHLGTATSFVRIGMEIIGIHSKVTGKQPMRSNQRMRPNHRLRPNHRMRVNNRMRLSH